MVAIDATDYSKRGNSQQQYKESEINREIVKAVTGIEGAQVFSDKNMEICSGPWGCGVFKGDRYLKFLIQWIACSVVKRKLVYKCDNEKQLKELKVMSNLLKEFKVCQLI